METNLERIHDYLISIDTDPKILDKLDSNPVTLAMEIAEYAYRRNYRDNGEAYVLHPKRVWLSYRNMIDVNSDEEKFKKDEVLLYRCDLKPEGVEEVCLLHDIIADGKFTMEEIEEIYKIADGGKLYRYFTMFIQEPLYYVTYNKTMDYREYIRVCKKHPTSALVKMLDLQDNLKVTELQKLDKEQFTKVMNYLKYIKSINNKYHFVEKVTKYHEKVEIWEDFLNFD